MRVRIMELEGECIGRKMGSASGHTAGHVRGSEGRTRLDPVRRPKLRTKVARRGKSESRERTGRAERIGECAQWAFVVGVIVWLAYTVLSSGFVR